jgi:Tc5 transposase DNA-binding domain
MLRRRHKGLAVSRAQANSNVRQHLNNTQEDELLRYIDALTERNIPLTTQFIKNLAEKILNDRLERIKQENLLNIILSIFKVFMSS